MSIRLHFIHIYIYVYIYIYIYIITQRFYRSTPLYCRTFYKGSFIRPLSKIFHRVIKASSVSRAPLSYHQGRKVVPSAWTSLPREALLLVVLSPGSVDFFNFGFQKWSIIINLNRDVPAAPNGDTVPSRRIPRTYRTRRRLRCKQDISHLTLQRQGGWHPASEGRGITSQQGNTCGSDKSRCSEPKVKDGFRWRFRRRTSASMSIRHGSWFQQNNLTFQEVIFLTTSYAAYLPISNHSIALSSLSWLTGANSADRPCC